MSYAAIEVYVLAMAALNSIGICTSYKCLELTLKRILVNGPLRVSANCLRNSIYTHTLKCQYMYMCTLSCGIYSKHGVFGGRFMGYKNIDVYSAIVVDQSCRRFHGFGLKSLIIKGNL